MTLAHAGEPFTPHDVWGAWTFDPFVLIGVAAAWWLYRQGARSAGRVGARERALFNWGLIVIAFAIVSPVDAMGSVLASAHMVQHLLLMMLGAPLIALARPGETLLLGVPREGRKRLGRLRRASGLTPSLVHRLAHPVLIWLMFAGVLWLWHLPALYEAALANDLVHAVEHVSFVAVAIPFWVMVLGAPRRLRGLAVLGIFTAALQMTVLAALLTFAETNWYPSYEETVEAWGMTPMQDQQLAGVIMWVPGGLVYLAAGLALFASWIDVRGSRSDSVIAPADGG